jgi:threonine synthase
MMHPKGRIAPLQERQMTTVLDGNVHNISVDGSFDDCQKMMKDLAGDLEFKRIFNIGAVNSVNWARVLAQIVYYFYSFFQLQKSGKKNISFSVPTGNFGDILAGWYAREMGLPIQRLLLATNENDILARFFQTGVYNRGEVFFTLSPAMDIQVSSNFERFLYYATGCDSKKLASLMQEFTVSGSLTLKTAMGTEHGITAIKRTAQDVLSVISEFHNKYGYILDPHTAVGVSAALALRLPDETVICLATAHPAKFPDAIGQAIPGLIPVHPSFQGITELPSRCVSLEASVPALKKLIEENT